MLEREHPLGRCRACDSTRARVRDGKRIVCLECSAGAASAEPLPSRDPEVPSENARRSDDVDALPKPPSRDELEHVAPHIRSAIAANVFLLARDGVDRWSGSGIIVMRDGNQVAILTNRHVVENSDTRRLCALRALTVAGEAITVSAVWRAGRGVDLALVEGRVEQLDGLGVAPLGTRPMQVGSPVFGIGNPLGLAWSYTGGTLSAVRNWSTSDGQSVRVLQTDALMAPGSSGGGLFDSEGHLLGVMSFGRQGYAGGSAHFALSLESIRDAFTREDVRWHGRALADI
jgi:S1-C subfamily serine protease